MLLGSIAVLFIFNCCLDDGFSIGDFKHRLHHEVLMSSYGSCKYNQTFILVNLLLKKRCDFEILLIDFIRLFLNYKYHSPDSSHILYVLSLRTVRYSVPKAFGSGKKLLIIKILTVCFYAFINGSRARVSGWQIIFRHFNKN